MAILPIVLYPDPVLLKPAAKVAAVDDQIRRLVRDMTETMYAAPGIGLAANQVGVSLRICIVDVTAGERPDSLVAFINPEVTRIEGSEVGEEGCLSFPDVTLEVERAHKATVEALDVAGQPFTYTAEGLMARAMLHEIEHLDGQTFLRNVSTLRRELVKKQIRKRIRSGDWVAEAAQ
jgi:peptide deformylase